MIRLDRSRVQVKSGWEERVAARFSDVSAFRERAKHFEALDMNCLQRRRGFLQYADEHPPNVLPEIKKKPAFPPLWQTERYVKDEISKMSAGHCAYCQSAIAGNQACHVDHFQPKSLFPSLAYLWDNYFLACETCNIRKSDRWPMGGQYVRPDESDPGARFTFSESGEITGAPEDALAKLTVTDIRLDRPSLNRARALAIAHAMRLLRIVLTIEAPFEQRRSLFQAQVVEPLSAFSVAINQNVLRLWSETFPDEPLFLAP